MLLKGLRVLDMSALLPGPMCSLFLADLGAEVIKIESPKGDMMRRFETCGEKSPYFEALNRNKKSVVIDLKTKEGKSNFLKLAKNADVIIEGFRPGKLNDLGVGYNAVKKLNPKIVYCSISGYGQKGHLKNKAGHDLNYSSLSGILDVMSVPPSVPGVQIADVGCALIAAVSILAALIHRGRTGKGNNIDVSVFNSALSLINIHIAQRSVSKKSRTVLSGTKPCYNIYKTKDDNYVSLGAIEAKFWESFCSSVGSRNLIKRQFDESAVQELRNLFVQKTQDEWLALNEKYDFCCEPVKQLNEVINDIHLNKSRAIINLDGVKQTCYPAVFSSFASFKYQNAPRLGENTQEVLSKLKSKKK